MIASDIRERLQREPFEPFQIRTSSGETYPVPMPYLVAIMKSKIFVAAPNSDDWAELSYLHISAIESLKNGHARHKRRRA